MDLMTMMLGAQGGGAIQQLAQQFGIGEEQARAAVAKMVPALSRGLKRDLADPDNAAGLMRALQRGGHQRYVDQPETLAAPETVADGNAILGHLFGSKEVSRQVAERVGGDTGLDSGMVKQMLPMVAALLMGSLSKQTAAQGGDGEGLMGMLGGLLDADGDGSVVDDLMGMAGRFFR
ncbi:MAG TPA: DUF937 domain-containing protein [Sedimenticola thiotaurini]|uniref:DUF937 domain-containing protein n=1 Tax=Sedimenticola thiotaurini TaxID=1543721 RepID=A0A831W2Z3_9GAMM|nr:DUF937 domain-containing protein [Sedimenticola thiotaurini]